MSDKSNETGRYKNKGEPSRAWVRKATRVFEANRMTFTGESPWPHKEHLTVLWRKGYSTTQAGEFLALLARADLPTGFSVDNFCLMFFGTRYKELTPPELNTRYLDNQVYRLEGKPRPHELDRLNVKAHVIEGDQTIRTIHVDKGDGMRVYLKAVSTPEIRPPFKGERYMVTDEGIARYAEEDMLDPHRIMHLISCLEHSSTVWGVVNSGTEP